MNFRKLLFWSHLVVGVVAGLVIHTMAITGILYAFQRQIIGAAERRIAPITAPANGARPLALPELAAKVAAALPEERPSAFTLRRDPAEPAVVNLGRERVILADPYTGAVVGEGTKLRGILHQIEHIHRDLAIGPNGKAITGAAALAFFALVLSGLYLWWPRKWNKQALKTATIPSLKLRGKARHWNWHNAFGFWAALPLLVSILTGVVMSYQWANNLLFRLTGSEVPPPRAARAERPERPASERPPFRTEGLDKMWTAAVERVPAWNIATFRFGEGPGAPVTAMMDEGQGNRPDLRAQLTFDRRSGELQKWEPYSSYSLGRQLRLWAKPVHTGEALGLIGQTLAALVAFAAVILVWTGFGLALRRFRQRGQPKPSALEEPSLAPLAEAPTSSSTFR
jgi:uncharacterized iron-regulated membrane protein